MIEPFEELPRATLSPTEERELIAKWRKDRDEEKLTKVILNNMRQAVLYARRVCRDKIPDDELVSVCYKALYRQAKRYNPTSRLKFFAFAKIGVRGETNRWFKQLDTVRNAKSQTLPEWAEGGACVVDNPDEGADERVARKDQVQFVLRSLRRCCSEKEQAIFALTYVGALGFNETARLLGVSRAAIQACHVKIVRKIRDDCRRSERLLFDANSGS